MRKPKECDDCGNVLDREQREAPNLNDCGKAICDTCWYQEYQFSCYCCGEYEHVDNQHKILVIAEECGRIDPGVYEITGAPYWTSNYFDMWFNPWALRRLGAVPERIKKNRDDRYPSGHLCTRCRDLFTFPRIWGVDEVRQKAC